MLVAYAYRRTRASRSYQQRPECLPKDQSVKKLSTKARVPTKGPERQAIIITFSSYKTREGGDKKELDGDTTRNNVRHDVLTVRLLHIPTEGTERQGVSNKGQSAYRRTRASRNYQQRPEGLPKDQSIKKLSTKARRPTEGPEHQEVISKGQKCQTGADNKRPT